MDPPERVFAVRLYAAAAGSRPIAAQSWRDWSFIPVLSITGSGDALALD